MVYPSHSGIAVYTSSWVAPKADVHSQQRFFYMGHKGEIKVDQAHRGYTVSKDGDGFKSVNPLFMKYTPTNGEVTRRSLYRARTLNLVFDGAFALWIDSPGAPSFVAHRVQWAFVPASDYNHCCHSRLPRGCCNISMSTVDR